MPSNRGLPEVGELRELARRGVLTGWMATAPTADRARVRQALYAVVWPIVFDGLTRSVELKRGHVVCAQGVAKLGTDCLDRFHDDVAAVVEGVLRRATCAIENLEAWIASRVNAATVDGYRRRRGERGALQRPRAPKWLVEQLDGDQWLVNLALHVLVWVGIPATAGNGLWPLDRWTEQRAATTGDWAGSRLEVVQAEVDRVLAAMCTHPRWYADHVERPLGCKQAPTASVPRAEHEFPPLTLVARHELDDGRLVRTARAAVRTIEARLRGGADARVVVPEVIRLLFCGDFAGDGIDQAPHETPYIEEWLAALLHDEADVDRVVHTVLAIIAESTDDADGPADLLQPGQRWAESA